MHYDFDDDIQGDENDFDLDELQLELFDDLEDVVNYFAKPDDLFDDEQALSSAGWGTDEDYGHYGDDY